MSLAHLLLSVAPVALLAALSPVLFANTSTLRLSSGAAVARRYALGAAGVLLLVVLLGAGLLGAGVTALFERTIASRTVDGVLGLLLLWYAVHLARSRFRDAQDAAPTGAAGGVASTTEATSGGQALRLGAIGMATNFTTLPLVLSVSQRIGGSGLPLWEVLGALALVSAVTLAPVWLPIALVSVRPSLVRPRGQAGPVVPRLGAWLPVAACVLGGLLLVARAVGPLW